MSDLASTGCGCGNDCQENNGCNSVLWIILLLCCCGNGNGCFGGNNGGCDCLWIIILLCCCGNGFGNNGGCGCGGNGLCC